MVITKSSYQVGSPENWEDSAALPLTRAKNRSRLWSRIHAKAAQTERQHPRRLANYIHNVHKNNTTLVSAVKECNQNVKSWSTWHKSPNLVVSSQDSCLGELYSAHSFFLVHDKYSVNRNKADCKGGGWMRGDGNSETPGDRLIVKSSEGQFC